MQIAKSIRKSNSNTVWIDLPVRAAAPMLVATSIAIGTFTTLQRAQPAARIEIANAGPLNLTSMTFRTEGNVMAKKIEKADNGNASFSIDPLEYGKLMEQVHSINTSLKMLNDKVDGLPTRDWVEKVILQQQVDKVNKNTNTRITVAGILITVIIAILNFVLPIVFG